MDWGFALCAKRSDFALFANTFGFGFCGGWGIPIVIFAVGENPVAPHVFAYGESRVVTLSRYAFSPWAKAV